MKIGFIGQGWIGKHYADNFEARGYDVVRYSLEDPYKGNKKSITDCGIVFIAVPTPTTREGFDASSVKDALSCIRSGSIAVIKSTILPGTTVELQSCFLELFVLHSPEFLREAHASHDAAHPERNIIGVPVHSALYQEKAKEVLSVLPRAPYEVIMGATDAELVKYAGNCFLYTKVVFMNMLFDLVTTMDGDWDAVREALVHDHRIGESHTHVTHSGGRGAGGHCFIKDFEAFRKMYEEITSDERGKKILASLQDKNNELLMESGKDIDLLRGVFGTPEE